MSSQDRQVKISKKLSLVLRHRPHEYGVHLDPAGWVDVGVLLEALERRGFPVTPDELEEVVRTSDKQRFAIDKGGRRIRANQGHSVAVELGLDAQAPPAALFHGTVEGNLASIAREGLVKGARHHVHLSPDVETAARVGGRRGEPVVLTIDSAAMQAAGFTFFVSANGVWLTDHVPPGYIRRDGRPIESVG
jgi:putative RNA 2'-phosphotransferase